MSDIEQIEISMEQTKELIRRKEMAMKLSSNREFKKLILEGYFQDEAARLVSISASPNMTEHRDEIFESITAISHFRQYMQNIVRMGETAEYELAEQRETLTELENMDDGDEA